MTSVLASVEAPSTTMYSNDGWSCATTERSVGSMVRAASRHIVTTLKRGRASATAAFLVVLVVDVHAPDRALVAAAGDDRVDRLLRRQHGVILVVVAVHAVASGQEKVRKRVQVFAQFAEARVAAIVAGIGFRNPDHDAVEMVRRCSQVQALHFGDSQLHQIAVRHRPELVAFAAEVLHPYPDRVRVPDEVGAPVV